MQNKQEKINCVICNSEFIKNRINQKYCSIECRYKADKNRQNKIPMEAICKYCDKKFIKDNTNRLKIYCSTDCARLDRYKKQPYWREWNILVEYCLERDNYTCQHCGEKNKKLVCHHIKPLALHGSNNIENLIILCTKCHSLAHAEIIKKMD